MKRNTIQKQLVLDTVTGLMNHPTADDVYKAIADKYKGISMGTVYRNLNNLASEGLIRKVSVPESADRFDHTVVPHYHAKCVNCGQLTDILINYIAELDNKVAEESGYKINEHEIVFKGECPSCTSEKI